MDPDCVHFVPFSRYNWTFARIGWLPWNSVALCLIVSFCAIAYWMCIELIVWVYITYKWHSGLYFWSTVVTTYGTFVRTIGYILKEFKNDCPDILTTIICKAQWISADSRLSIVLF